VFTFDSQLYVGGRWSSSDATGGQSKTGFVNFGFTGNQTYAKVTSASHASSRTYTLDDIGADASFVMTAGTQTVGGNKTLSGITALTGGLKLGVTALKVTNYTLTAADVTVGFDATTGALNATLPASPADGEVHVIFKADNSANAVTVVRNGHDFVDAAADFVLASVGDKLTVQYINSLTKWLKL
jgi:hypothetical protein